MRYLATISLVLLITGAIARDAAAAPIVFQGGDVGANSTDPRPNSNATAASFDLAASVLGTLNIITFESAPVGSFSSLVAAAGVTLTGDDVIGNDQEVRNSAFGTPESIFGYNTTSGGSRFVSLQGGNLVFTFATSINAFGAYLSGVQLAGETITFSDGSNQSIAIQNNGSGAQFVGFTDAGQLISSITLNVQIGGTGDIIGVDDVRFVRGAAAVPEPTSLLLLGSGLIGAAIRRRKTAPRG